MKKLNLFIYLALITINNINLKAVNNIFKDTYKLFHTKYEYLWPGHAQTKTIATNIFNN